jgi:acetoin utilization deacetylase AcuC-like enzyme
MRRTAHPANTPTLTVTRRDFLRLAAGAVAGAATGALAADGSMARRAVDGPTVVFHDPACFGHLAGRQAGEQPARLEAVLAAANSPSLKDRVVLMPGRPAREEDILRVHDRDYLALVKREVKDGRVTLSTGDTALSRESYGAALAAAGCVITAVDTVMAGTSRNAFCAVRPPGHHASAGRGMGFCIFNNIAIGARHAQAVHGVKRVLIADWDVHHGNGTQEVFWSDGSVLFFDTHQSPWYPGTGDAGETGSGKGRGLIINRPFPAGAGRREILGAFESVLLPAAEAFRPELVMISAGFDSRIGDPLGRFTLTDRDFADLTDLMLGIASRHAAGRVVSVLEGGYALKGLASAVSAHLERLAAAG